MRGLLRTAIVAIVVFGLILAIYRMFGGDLGSLLGYIWDFFYMLIEGMANIWGEVLKLFGIGS